MFNRSVENGPVIGRPVTGKEASRLRTMLFRVDHGGIYRRADGGWTICIAGCRTELLPVTVSVAAPDAC